MFVACHILTKISYQNIFYKIYFVRSNAVNGLRIFFLEILSRVIEKKIINVPEHFIAINQTILVR